MPNEEPGRCTEMVSVVDADGAECQRRERRDRAGHDMVSGAENLLAHWEVDAVTAPVRHRADASVLGITARRGCARSAPARPCLNRHVPILRDAQHGGAGTGRYAGQHREDQVEVGQVEEDGTHEHVRLDGSRRLCQRPRLTTASGWLTGEGAKD